MSIGREVFETPNPRGSPIEKILSDRRRLLEPSQFRAYLQSEHGLTSEQVDAISRAFEHYDNDKNFALLRYLDEMELWGNIHRHQGAIPVGAPDWDNLVDHITTTNISTNSTEPSYTLNHPPLMEVGDVMFAFFAIIITTSPSAEIVSVTTPPGWVRLHTSEFLPLVSVSRPLVVWVGYKRVTESDLGGSSTWEWTPSGEHVNWGGILIARIPQENVPEEVPFGPLGFVGTAGANESDPPTRLELPGVSGDWVLALAIGGTESIFVGTPRDAELQAPVQEIHKKINWGHPERGISTHLGFLSPGVNEEGEPFTIEADYTNQSRRYLIGVGIGNVLADPSQQEALPHALGGEKHLPDLLANVNDKILDATLDDINDPRTPKSHDHPHDHDVDYAASPHALGGSDHSADTLANLNSKVSDATLDDAGDARTPTAHAATHEPGGSDAMAVDAAVGTGSLRTLGEGATQAAAGDHSHASVGGPYPLVPLANGDPDDPGYLFAADGAGLLGEQQW